MKRFWRAAFRPIITVVDGTSARDCMVRIDRKRRNMVALHCGSVVEGEGGRSRPEREIIIGAGGVLCEITPGFQLKNG